MSLFFRFSIVALVLSLAGCGFHLRGDHALPDSISPVYIEGISRFSDFRRELTTAFSANGVKTAQSAGAAATVLKLSGHSGDEFVTGVDASGAASEYELKRRISYQLIDVKNGKELVPRRSATKRRLFSQSAVIGFGKSLERGEINDQLDRELIDEILRTIGLATKN